MARTTTTTQTQDGITIVEDEPTGWVGWIAFAAVMMMIAGVLQMIDGFVAVVNDEWVVWGNTANLYLDLTTWGWIHMGIGALVLLGGIALLSGNILARTLAVVLASVSLIANFMFMPAYPVWSIAIIVIDLLVLYAVIAHGRELKST
jgi:hypothetical protein